MGPGGPAGPGGPTLPRRPLLPRSPFSPLIWMRSPSSAVTVVEPGGPLSPRSPLIPAGPCGPNCPADPISPFSPVDPYNTYIRLKIALLKTLLLITLFREYNKLSDIVRGLFVISHAFSRFACVNNYHKSLVIFIVTTIYSQQT